MYNARHQVLINTTLGEKNIHITTKQGNVSFQIGPYETSLLLRVITFRNQELLTNLKHWFATFVVSLLSTLRH